MNIRDVFVFVILSIEIGELSCFHWLSDFRFELAKHEFLLELGQVLDAALDVDEERKYALNVTNFNRGAPLLARNQICTRNQV